jgi:hypothetical protein
MVEFKETPFPSPPPEPTLTRVVFPAVQLRTNTCLTPLVTPGTRFLATESKATNWPFPLMAGVSDQSFP